MSTSFSTIRSSNCWILKSLRLKAVLHSGQAAEGLVNSVSTQVSHLAVKIKRNKKNQPLVSGYWAYNYQTINAKTSIFQCAITWFLLESQTTYNLWPHTFTRSFNLGFLYLVVLHLGQVCQSSMFNVIFHYFFKAFFSSPLALSCSQGDNVGSLLVTTSILIGCSK